MTPPTPQQHGVGETPQCNSSKEDSKATQLQEDIRSGERWLIGISLASVIMNIVIAVIYYGQLCQMKEATEAAKKAAEAAESANTNATDALHKTERPWVGAIKVEGDIQVPTGKSNIKVQYTNSGKAPALHVHWVTQTDCEPKYVRPKILYGEKDALTRGEAVLVPGQDAFTTIDDMTNICSAKNADLVAKSNGLVYIIGTLWYRDPFDIGHHTDFCFLLGIKDKGWRPCRFHN